MSKRRDFITATAGFCVYALLHEARAAVPTSRGMLASRWIQRQEELARGLADGAVSQTEWHEAVNGLAREVDLESLSTEIRRANVRSAGGQFGHDPQKRLVNFVDEQGTPKQQRYAVALFTFDADSVITPHAHKHMASAHLVIEGKLRVRTFDRIRDDRSALILQPAIDEVAAAGHTTAMTMARDNVHWFTPRSQRAMTLDVIVDGLDKGFKRYEIQPVDPLGGEEMPDGTIRAPLLTFERSAQIYKSNL